MRSLFTGIIVLILFCLSFIRPVYADLEWTSIKEHSLSASPLDMAVSEDEKWIFILTSGSILVYSIDKDELIKEIQVDKSFDKIILSPKKDRLILSSLLERKVKIIKIDKIYEISSSGLPFLGNEKALVTVAIFIHYKCPYCSKLDPLVADLLKSYGDKIKIVFKNFPFGNPLVKKASAAAIAAGRQGKFWDYHLGLHDKKKPLNDAKMENIAKSLQLDMEKFNKDIKDPAITALIDRDISDGKNADIRGVPTIFINGRPLKRENAGALQQMIAKELEKYKVDSENVE
ncbi:Thioredoxin domain-containing protein [Candidatus Magnetomoraceae bacterium gMMP-15]